jgi:hypothetical protein
VKSCHVWGAAISLRDVSVCERPGGPLQKATVFKAAWVNKESKIRFFTHAKTKGKEKMKMYLGQGLTQLLRIISKRPSNTTIKPRWD